MKLHMKQYVPPGCTYFDDCVPGTSGVEGWWRLEDGHFRIHLFGTDSNEDWGNNAKARKRGKLRDTDAAVHRGAYRYATRIIGKFHDKIADATEVTISGHSMGSMIAPVVAFLYRHMSDKRWTVILTGAVPVGDYAFLKAYQDAGFNSATTNVRTMFDLFTHIVAPLMRLFLGYRQVGRIVRKRVKNPFRLIFNHRYPQYQEYHNV